MTEKNGSFRLISDHGDEGLGQFIQGRCPGGGEELLMSRVLNGTQLHSQVVGDGTPVAKIGGRTAGMGQDDDAHRGMPWAGVGV